MLTTRSPANDPGDGLGAGRSSAARVPHRWRNLAALTGVTVVDNTESALITTLFPSIAATLRLNNTALGLVAAAGKIIALPFGIGWIWLAGRTSRKTALVSAGIAGGLFGILAGFADSFPFLLMANTLMSAAIVGAGPIANAVIADSFDDRQRSRAVGWFYGISTLLSSLFGPVTAQLSGFTNGWRYGMWVVGAVCILAGLAVGLVFKEPAVGGAETQLTDQPTEQVHRTPVTWSTVLTLFTIPTFTIMMISRLLSGHLLITVFGVQFLVTERGFTNAVAALIMLPYGCGYCIGALVAGRIAEALDQTMGRRGRVALLQTSQVLFAVAAFLGTQFVHDTIAVYGAFSALMGALQAVNPVTNRPIVMSVVLPDLRGQAFAIFLTVFDTIGWGLFTLLGGRLADQVGVQTLFLWALVVVMLINAAWITLLYFTYPRDAARMDHVLDRRRSANESESSS